MKELHSALVSIAGSDKKEYQIQDLCKAFEITGNCICYHLYSSGNFAGHFL